jgi:hypothetical protein
MAVYGACRPTRSVGERMQPCRMPASPVRGTGNPRRVSGWTSRGGGQWRGRRAHRSGYYSHSRCILAYGTYS